MDFSGPEPLTGMQWTDGNTANLDAAGRWSPGIGDPSVMGWVTVAVYLLASVLCARTSRRSDPQREGWKLWASLAMVLFLLGVNKQLDLQSLFTQIGRDLALSQGWYEQRRWVQGGFIALLALGALSLGWWLRGALQEPAQRMAGLGLAFLMAFVVMRAASFHHMDQLINATWAGVRMNWVLELAGLVVILLATRRAARDRLAATGSEPGSAASPPPLSPGLRPGPAPGTSAGDDGDPPLIAWLRVRLAPVRAPIERHLRRRAEEARRLAREQARAAASPSPAPAPPRPAPRGEVTRVRRRT